MQFEVLRKALQAGEYAFTEVTSDTDVSFRLIPYVADLLAHPFFIKLEFHERPGALAEFLRAVSPHANLCYFNYAYSGERVGRALLGFEFKSAEAQQNFPTALEAASDAYRTYEPLPELSSPASSDNFLSCKPALFSEQSLPSFLLSA